MVANLTTSGGNGRVAEARREASIAYGSREDPKVEELQEELRR